MAGLDGAAGTKEDVAALRMGVIGHFRGLRDLHVQQGNCVSRLVRTKAGKWIGVLGNGFADRRWRIGLRIGIARVFLRKTLKRSPSTKKSTAVAAKKNRKPTTWKTSRKATASGDVSPENSACGIETFAISESTSAARESKTAAVSDILQAAATTGIDHLSK
jgi:hypothetical protein